MDFEDAYFINYQCVTCLRRLAGGHCVAWRIDHGRAALLLYEDHCPWILPVRMH